MLRAIALLKDAGYPKSSYLSLSKMFEKTGIMSSPFEERVRYIYALGEEVGRTLSQIDGVITARVHIVLPEAPQLGQPVKPSSAAIFIKHRPGVDLDFFQPQIRRLVSSAIEGLEYNSVTVVLSEAKPTETSAGASAEQAKTVEILPGLSVSEASRGRFWGLTFVTSLISVAVTLIMTFSATVLLRLWRTGKLRRRPPGDTNNTMIVEPS
jgi:type III secretion protein J